MGKKTAIAGRELIFETMTHLKKKNNNQILIQKGKNSKINTELKKKKINTLSH